VTSAQVTWSWGCLARLAADVSYSLDELPPPPPVFALIAAAGLIPAAVMYATFNMAPASAWWWSPGQQRAAIDALRGAGDQLARIGVVTDRPGRRVSIPSAGLTGRGEAFESAG